MITQAIIDYVKAQQVAGVSREQITADLQTEGGWTPEQIEEAFAEVDRGNVWTKAILWTNWITLGISLGMMLLINLPLVESSPLPEVAQWMFNVMVGTLVVFGVFVLFENFVLRKFLRDRPSSNLDPWIMALVSMRNFIVILSVIPFIQFLGLAVLGWCGIPWFLLYVILVIQRFRQPAENVAVG